MRISLLSKYDDVQGVELSNIAVRSFFAEHFYTPLVMPVDAQHELYQFDELSIYVGDFCVPFYSCTKDGLCWPEILLL